MRLESLSVVRLGVSNALMRSCGIKVSIGWESEFNGEFLSLLNIFVFPSRCLGYLDPGDTSVSNSELTPSISNMLGAQRMSHG